MVNPPLKRKAEDLSTAPAAKILRTEAPTDRPLNGSLPSHPKAKLATTTAMPVVAAIVRPGLTPKTSSADIKAVIPSTKSRFDQSPLHATATKPPPKGSYREILARAEAAKAAQAEIGQIKHKPVPKDPKLSRKERLAQEAEASQKAKQEARSAKISRREVGKLHSSGSLNREPEQAKEKKKPVDLGYKGTMRPAPTPATYKGTARTQSTTTRPPGRLPSKDAPKRPPDTANSSQRYRYASYSDEEEDEEEEDYDDESDMEAAGFDELEEEEQTSLKLAKKEDDEALKEENEHKKLKAEKRKKLEQLVASRRK